MNREFDLEEISFDDFEKLRFSVGALGEKSSCSGYFGRLMPKGFFRIIGDAVTYSGLDDLLIDVDDEAPFLTCVSVPKHEDFGEVGEAARRTRHHQHKYFRRLIANEEDLGKIVVNFGNPESFGKRVPRRELKYYTDSFEFVKKDGLWVFRRFNIHHPDFDFYTLKKNGGVFDLSDFPAVCGVYDGD